MLPLKFASPKISFTRRTFIPNHIESRNAYKADFMSTFISRLGVSCGGCTSYAGHCLGRGNKTSGKEQTWGITHLGADCGVRSLTPKFFAVF